MSKSWEVEIRTESETLVRFDEKIVLPKIGESITVGKKYSDDPRIRYRVTDIIHNYVEYYNDEVDIEIVVDVIK